MGKYQTNSQKEIKTTRRDISTLAAKSTGDAQEQQHTVKNSKPN